MSAKHYIKGLKRRQRKAGLGRVVYTTAERELIEQARERQAKEREDELRRIRIEGEKERRRLAGETPLDKLVKSDRKRSNAQRLGRRA